MVEKRFPTGTRACGGAVPPWSAVGVIVGDPQAPLIPAFTAGSVDWT